MKLRIQNNSLRFRMTQNEVRCLRDQGIVESSLRFPAGTEFRYSVASSAKAAAVSVNYEHDSIIVLVPATVVAAWAESDESTIEGSDGAVAVLVEKDFQCLHKSGEPDPDAYPNPLAAIQRNDG